MSSESNDIRELRTLLAPSEEPGSLGRIGGYEVLELAGRGTMGIVCVARHVRLQRPVAIKLIVPDLLRKPSARERFFGEARCIASVGHANVVAAYEVGEDRGLPYIVMEYVSGTKLEDWVKRGGPRPAKEIARVGWQAAQGLTAIHKQGIIHRDIEPSNILLEDGSLRVKIIDFGLGRAMDAPAVHPGVVIGTPMYMSPEQARGDALDQRTDLFSLGSVLYLMCTGRHAFEADDVNVVLTRVCTLLFAEITPNVPDWLRAIVNKLMAKAPAMRFQTAQEVAQVLEPYATSAKG